ncbi:MAG TPA: hypothetical protein VG870_11040 [Chitinophagaceae bacterium]|nr:hypothetical protein [Chitinophagaceae bacterium]
MQNTSLAIYRETASEIVARIKSPDRFLEFMGHVLGNISGELQFQTKELPLCSLAEIQEAIIGAWIRCYKSGTDIQSELAGAVENLIGKFDDEDLNNAFDFIVKCYSESTIRYGLLSEEANHLYYDGMACVFLLTNCAGRLAIQRNVA